MHFDIKEIVSAWASKVRPTEDQKNLATRRAEICNQCPDIGEAVKGADGTRFCKNCGCLIEAKIYSYKEGACPKGKWDDIDRKFANTKALKVLKNPKKTI